MSTPKVCLRRGEEHDIQCGKLWIFNNEIDWYDDICENGGIVDVVDSKMQFICRGYFNAKSKIVVRILSRNPNENIDELFIRNRILRAWNIRKSLGFSNSCRVVFGDSDLLPGLTIDKFGDYISFQTASLGMENLKAVIIRSIIDIFQPLGIMERNDIQTRKLEGLELVKGCVYGSIPDKIVIRENDANMYVDLYNGQKTGHFLDQQENRGRIKPYVYKKDVLDLCCCSGGFSIHASLYGANSVIASDASAQALELVLKNAELNHCSNISTVESDVFELLRKYSSEQILFDTVILDPPAFAKSKNVLSSAYRGYKEINLHAMRIIRSGGFLLTFSCSKFMTPEIFTKMLVEAAADSGREVKLLERLTQSRDHASSIASEDALYLKGCILQIL